MKPSGLILLLVCLVFAGCAATPDAPSAWAIPREPPTIGPEHELLWKWVGDWTSEHEFGPQGSMPGGKGVGTGKVEKVLDGFFVLVSETGTVTSKGPDGKEVERSESLINLWTYDQKLKIFRVWWFNSGGFAGELKADYDAATRTFTAQHSFGKREVKFVTAWVTDDEFTDEAWTRPVDKSEPWKRISLGKYKRVKR